MQKNNLKEVLRKYKALIAILFLFGLLFSSISLVNHYFFRTSAHDLGIYISALYDYNHFQKNTSTIFIQPLFVNSLNDHFELLPMLWAPFYYIFGTYALLIIQIVSILFGSLGIYKIIERKTNNHPLALLAAIHFLSIWGIYSALSFDYHNNVVAAMLVPWFMYYVDKTQWIKASLFLLLILVSKENMALWAVFINIGLGLLHRKERLKIKMSVAFGIASALYFIIVLKVIMPALGLENDTYNHFHYDALGKNMSEAFMTILKHPIHAFRLLFENHTQDNVAYGIKTELHLMVFISGGWALLFRPHYLLMLIPIYAQKLYNNDYGKWGINAHYSIEFVPIISVALFDVISSLDDKTISKNLTFISVQASIKYATNLYKYVAITSCLLTFAATIWKTDHRTSKWYNATKQRFYSKEHYRASFEAPQVHEALHLIPDHSIVSVQANLAPHLAYRDTIYLFPEVKDAQYIAILHTGSYYPTTKEKFELEEQKYMHSEEWKVLYNQNNTILLKKR